MNIEGIGQRTVENKIEVVVLLAYDVALLLIDQLAGDKCRHQLDACFH